MLYVVATPIGNLDDMSPRGIAALRAADIVACEDTRRTRILFEHFDIPRPARVVSYREQTEERQSQALLGNLEDGQTVALCSDGGFPGISDPGYRLIRVAIDHDLPFEVIPGASAGPIALLMSGLPTSSFTFKGYPPKKAGKLRTFFANEQDAEHTLILYESPMRTGKTLAAAADVLGPRRAAVCMELTKKFERVERGYLDELAVTFAERSIKGEVTLVIAGNNPKFIRQPPEATS